MSDLVSPTQIGHGRIREVLARAVHGRRHHAYLFSGPARVGKGTVARAFVGAVLNRPVERWEDLGSHPDCTFLERDPEKKLIGVEGMRRFLRHFAATSLLGGAKVGVIIDAHDLSPEAANALLKTLEEPPGNSLIVLLTDDIGRLPETIRSRAQNFRFLPVPVAEIEAGLVRRGVSKPEAAALARLSSGSPGLALSFLADPAAREERERHVRAFASLLSAPLAERLAAAVALAADADARSVRGLLDVWGAALRDLLCVKTGNERSVAHSFALPELRDAAARRTVPALVSACRALRDGRRALGENVAPRLALESIALTL